MTGWFERAQTYELGWHLKMAREGAHFVTPDAMADFFDSDPDLYDSFIDGIRGKAALEIGCGLWPSISKWPVSRMVLVDPLLYKYPGELMLALPAPAELHPVQGEVALPALKASIDGAIVCRNCLDHSADPVALLAALLDCAMPGCTLLFWGGYAYVKPPDEGHRSWAASADEVRAMIEPRFEIVREVHCNPAPHVLDWGCVAICR